MSTPAMTAEPVRVVAAGTTGYVGRALVSAVLAPSDFRLVAAVGRTNIGRGVAVVAANPGLDATELAAIGESAAADDVGARSRQLPTAGRLMMRCAELIAPHIADVEIVAGRPSTKPDSPSRSGKHSTTPVASRNRPRPGPTRSKEPSSD